LEHSSSSQGRARNSLCRDLVRIGLSHELLRDRLIHLSNDDKRKKHQSLITSHLRKMGYARVSKMRTNKLFLLHSPVEIYFICGFVFQSLLNDQCRSSV
jgi:hypothetical protein